MTPDPVAELITAAKAVDAEFWERAKEISESGASIAISQCYADLTAALARVDDHAKVRDAERVLIEVAIWRVKELREYASDRLIKAVDALLAARQALEGKETK